MTQANRQDIVTTSQRNTDIRNRLADVFIQAVGEMCGSPTLKYTWMRFLPDQQRYTYDRFWWELFTDLKRKLYNAPCVQSRSRNHLSKIKDLRRLPSFCADDEGYPLFKDLNTGIWLSENYSGKDIAILERFGMPTVEVRTLIDMIEQDLRSPDSRMKSKQADEDWHTHAAKMLAEIADKSGACLDRLRKLDLLPIRQLNARHTSWVSSHGAGTVFFAKSDNGVCIPQDVHPWVLEPDASQNQARVRLFERLGVLVAKEIQVRQMIKKRHQLYLEQPQSVAVTPQQVTWLNSQLGYLCITQGLDSTREQPRIALIDNHWDWWSSTSEQPLYLPDDEPFGPQELFKKTNHGVDPGSGAPGLQASFLHSDLLKPERSDIGQGIWMSWLTRHARVRDQVMLVSRTVDQLSSECKYVARHRPEKFLGFLKHRWSVEGKEVECSQNKLKELRSLQALCHGNRREPFRYTYLPLADLQEICNELLEPDDQFPFLDLQDTIRRETYAKLNWSFLVESASVNVADNLTFYLDILRHLCGNSAVRLPDHDRVVRLYSRIFAKFVESSDKIKAKAEIMSVCGENAFSCVVLLTGNFELTRLSQRMLRRRLSYLRSKLWRFYFALGITPKLSLDWTAIDEYFDSAANTV